VDVGKEEVKRVRQGKEKEIEENNFLCAGILCVRPQLICFFSVLADSQHLGNYLYA